MWVFFFFNKIVLSRLFGTVFIKYSYNHSYFEKCHYHLHFLGILLGEQFWGNPLVWDQHLVKTS